MRSQAPISWREFLIYVVLGSGTLAAWNALIITAGYLESRFPGKHVDRLLTVCYLPVDLAVTACSAYWHSRLPVRPRVLTGYGTMVASLALIAVVGICMDTSSYALVSVLILAAGAGCGEALLQPALWAQAAPKPAGATHALITGTAWSGLAACGLSALAKATLPGTPEGLRAGAIATLGLTITWLVLCVGLYLAVFQRPTTVSQLKGRVSDPGVAEAPRQGRRGWWRWPMMATIEMATRPPGPAPPPEPVQAPSLQVVEGVGLLHDIQTRSGTRFSFAGEPPADAEPPHGLTPGLFESIWPLWLATCITYVVTLSIFPGVLVEDSQMTRPSAQGAGSSWALLWFITAFNFGDMVGKASPTFVPQLKQPPSRFVVLIASCLRILFIPAFLFSVRSAFLLATCTLLLGLSNGALTSIAMGSAPSYVHSNQRERAGSAMVLGLMLGLTLGAALSFLWLLHQPAG